MLLVNRVQWITSPLNGRPLLSVYLYYYGSIVQLVVNMLSLFHHYNKETPNNRKNVFEKLHIIPKCHGKNSVVDTHIK